MIFFTELLARIAVVYLVKKGTWPLIYLQNYNTIEDALTLIYSLFIFYKAIHIVFRDGVSDTPILAFDDLHWLKLFIYLGGFVFLLWIMALIFNVTGIVEKPYI